jgi:hypothetical protein
MLYQQSSFEVWKMKSFRSLSLIMIILLSACAAPTPQQKAQWNLDASRPVTCSKGSDCEVKWSRALSWVQNNSRWKLRIANENLITTEGPFDTPSAAYSITKVANSDGIYTIDFRAGCGNIFGCVPSILQLQADFVNYVMGPVKAPAAIIQKDATTGRFKLGITMAKTNLSSANILGMKEPRGVIVLSVVQDSVAYGAGMKQGDAILKYGDKIVNDVSDVQAAVAETATGSTTPITIWRAGQGEMVVSAQFHE